MMGLSVVKSESNSPLGEPVGMLLLRLQGHEIHDVDHPDLQVG